MERPLWAPWRVSFIRGKKADYCFLCDHRQKRECEEEDIIVYRGKSCFVILNAFPYNSGHLLVAPYRHVGDLAELTLEEREELMELTVRCEQTLRRLMRPEAFNIGLNLGKAAGAGVADHLHMHVVPRWTGDTNFMPVLADTRCVPEALSNTAELIRSEICK